MAVSINKRLKPSGKGTPPAAAETRNNLGKPPNGTTVPIQVQVSPEFRRRFRVYAAERDMELSHLFVTMFEYYEQHQG